MSQITIEQATQIAVGHFQAGRLHDAESTCRQILAAQPKHPGALHMLGMIAGQTGRTDSAIDLIRQAIIIAPGIADFHCNLGVLLQSQGQIDQAIACFKRALALKPEFAEAHNNLGAAFAGKGDLDQAIACCRSALALKPYDAGAHNNLGNMWKSKGEIDQAIVCYERAVALQPSFAQAHANLGNAWSQKGRIDQAIACYQRALALKPDYAEAHINLGRVLMEKGEVDQAIACYQRALALNPDYPEAHSNLGGAWMRKGQIAQAVYCYQRALALKPNDPDMLNNLGSALIAQRHLVEAEQFLRAAIAAQPDHASAHWNLGLLFLLQGDYERGLPLHEWRRKVPGLGTRASLPGTEWDGSDLAGRRILIHAEQGFGDVIQCVRYVPLIAQRGGKIVLSIPVELMRLMQCLEPIVQLMALNDPLPGYDVHCSIMSLPLMFRTTLQSIPATMPYLIAPQPIVERWRPRLEAAGKRKIGLVWAGAPSHREDQTRSMTLQAFAPLAAARDVLFICLQKGSAESEARNPPAGMQLVSLGPELNDYLDTAAVITQLDLVISVDTSVAHLAGALGKPVWVLLKYVPDWRWLLDRQDSPWYPTMRLFRQTTPGEWQTPISQIVNELDAMALGRQPKLGN